MYLERDILNDQIFASIVVSQAVWEALDGLCKDKPHIHELLELSFAAYQL